MGTACRPAINYIGSHAVIPYEGEYNVSGIKVQTELKTSLLRLQDGAIGFRIFQCFMLGGERLDLCKC